MLVIRGHNKVITGPVHEHLRQNVLVVIRQISTARARFQAGNVFERILDFANRADPYPLYAELRKPPVLRAPNGSFVVSTYREVTALIHDPRVSTDGRAGGSFIGMDPPGHDRLRRLATSHFDQSDTVTDCVPAVRSAMLKECTPASAAVNVYRNDPACASLDETTTVPV